MTDKRFHNGIELKNDLLWFKNIDHIPHITDIVLGYNTILEENKQLKKENGDLKETIKDLHDLLARYEERIMLTYGE